MPSGSDRAQAIGIALILAACRGSAPLPDGDVAATLTAPALGAPFDPATLRGKPALVLFVSPSCVHCMKELPIAQDVAREANANIVAVFVTGKRDNASAFVAQTHFAGPALFDDGSLKARYAVGRVPYTLVLGADGHATDAFLGEQDAQALRDAISRGP
jgi:thiol-disulfide isomerase/thioredoxin